MNALSARRVVVALACAFAFVSALVSACHPLGLEGESCADAPCADGLTCVDEVCKLVEPPPPPEPPCDDDVDCTLRGSADGRVCNDGVCEFADCALDLQCGARICDNGKCADDVPCFADDDCDDDQVCDGNSCRAPCLGDDDCTGIGGVSLAACVDGICVQRCLGDFMCLGGICDENLCVDPQCEVDPDCAQDVGNFFCNAGRCEAFTPCDDAEDCFDPNLLCNDLGRCEERPTCTVDADCGVGLCVDRHCRDAVGCAADADCASEADNTECVAGRCTQPPLCRDDAGCADGDVCDGARCVNAADAEPAFALVVDTGIGVCRAAAAPELASGVCALVVRVGEAPKLRVQAYDDDGAPIVATIDATDDGAAEVEATVSSGVSVVTVDVLAAGTATVRITSGDLEADIAVTAVEASAADASVLVVDGATGGPVAGAAVIFGEDTATTDASGYAESALTTSTAGVIVRADERGVALLVNPLGSWRVVLAAPAVDVDGDSSEAAGVQAHVISSGDETGPTGISFALAATARNSDASLAALFGPVFAGAIEVQLLGNLPVALPAAAIVDGALPLGQAQQIKGEALLALAPGPAVILAYEGRYEQQALVNLVFGIDPTETALDFAAQAEGDDAALVAAGLLAPLPLVVDGEITDGVDDVDGDGDVAELVPDYFSFPVVETTPTGSPPVRAALFVGPPPGVARTRAFAVCGVDLAGLFVPIGVAAVFGTDADAAAEGAVGEQLKALAPGAEFAGQPRTCVVHAVFDDPETASFARVTSGGLGARVELGALLEPPEGAFVLSDVPAVGDDSLVVPSVPEGADALVFTVVDETTTWTVVAPAGGSLALPPAIAASNALALTGTQAARLEDGADVFDAYRTERAMTGGVLDVARAASRAP